MHYSATTSTFLLIFGKQLSFIRVYDEILHAHNGTTLQ